MWRKLGVSGCSLQYESWVSVTVAVGIMTDNSRGGGDICLDCCYGGGVGLVFEATFAC